MIGFSNVMNYGNTYGLRSNYSNGKVQNSNNQQNSHKVYLKTDDMLYSGGNGTGLSFYIKYAEDSTKDNPIVFAKGVDENGKEFQQKIAINDIDPSNASITEMRALESHFGVNKGLGLSSLPNEAGTLGLSDKRNFLNMFNKTVKDMNTLGRFDLALNYSKNLQFYSNMIQQK